MRTVVVFGDSIAAGQHVPPHLAWPARLSAQLWPDTLVVNASRNGDTTRMALERMDHDVPAHDILIVQFGLNDCNIWPALTDPEGWPRVNADSFRSNLREIVARSDGRTILVTNHETAKSNAYRLRSRHYNSLIREVACGRVIDMEREDVDLLDDIHPSVAGHALYAEMIGSAIDG